MTPNKHYLFLNRLVITTYDGLIAYDQEFHKGVNIIRGKNSSGKSTIANFIFYVLGGDYNNWNTESQKCHEVYAEVEINSIVFTIKRIVSEFLRQPMSVYWGHFEAAKLDTINWKTFSYSQTDDKVSFTNILFNALNFPEVKSESESNITMHQILRLLYIDQDSPTQCLFRRENFDQPQTRQAISEVLLGIYNDDLYNNRLGLRRANKEYEEKKREFESLNKVFVNTGSANTIDGLYKEIEKAKKELSIIQEEIGRTKDAAKIRVAKNSPIRVEKIQKDLVQNKEQLMNLNSQAFNLDLDIIDSKNFIEMLEKRIIDLDDSIVTRKALGDISLNHCPNCLNPLTNDVEESKCFLCKQPILDSEERTHAKRLKQELQLQVKESSKLLSNKERQLAEIRGSIPEYKEKVVTLQRELDNAIAESQSSRDDKMDELLIQKGGIEKQIELLAQQLKGIEVLDQLKKEIIALKAYIEQLSLTIDQQESQQVKNKEKALSGIQQKSKYILNNDLDRQGEFKTANKVEIDFYGDSMALDGNFNFSASSNTYLKNAIRFAIFFTSLDIDFMRYPKFILCDNMEDKGMEKERTQNFQKLVAKMSTQYLSTINHQIIFTTSMIADELDGTAYCIGSYYDQTHKTLQI